VTFNGQDYSDNNFTFFYYNVGNAFPRSGPSDGTGGPIKIDGSGFRNEPDSVYCSLDKVFYEPLSVVNGQILCPMPRAKQGPQFFGNVDFAVIIDGNWHKFTGGF
jgi:IPT/TIG domain